MEDCPDQLVRTKSRTKCQQLCLLITRMPGIVCVVSKMADGTVFIRLDIDTCTDVINIQYISFAISVFGTVTLICELCPSL